MCTQEGKTYNRYKIVKKDMHLYILQIIYCSAIDFKDYYLYFQITNVIIVIRSFSVNLN